MYTKKGLFGCVTEKTLVLAMMVGDIPKDNIIALDLKCDLRPTRSVMK